MSKTLLAGLTAAFVAFSAIPVHAAVDDAMLIARVSGVQELARSGAAMVSFVEGRPVVERKVEHVVPVSLSQSNEQADRYYDGSVLFTFAMLVIAAAAFVVAAASSTKFEREDPEEPRRENWRDEVLRMLEADLTNFDGLSHGMPR